MTIYPYLLLLLLLSLLSFLMPGPKLPGLVRYYLFFVLFFFTYALLFLPFVPGKADAIIDLRSIALMLMTTWVFISVYRFFGFEKWRRIILFSLKLILAAVIIFALLEMVTGWHVAGSFTEKIASRGLPDGMMHMPVFLWDNPNNFMLYLLLLSAALLLLEPAGPAKSNIALCLLFVLLVFSVVQEARIAQVAIVCGALVYGLHRFARSPRGTLPAKHWWYIGFVFIASVYAVVSRPVFTEIPPAQAQKIDQVSPLHPVMWSIANARPDITRPDSLRITAPEAVDSMAGRNSVAERSALLRNGLSFLSGSYGMGVGPGQYRYRHNAGLIKHYAFGNNGAHFWFVELVSQYGVMVFTAYLLVLGWMLLLVVKGYRRSPEIAAGLLIGLMVLGLGSLLPSAFLILDINWIFTVILVICAGELARKKVSG